MGKINAGILGGVSGKVGPIVGGSWKGINYLRQMPASVANPRTAGQVAQRNKFSEVVKFAVVLLAAIIKPLWDRFAVKQSGYNEFVSKNVDNYDAAGDIVSLTGFTMSQGKLPGIIIDDVLSDGTDLLISYSPNTGGLALNTDELYLVVLDTDGTVLYQQKTASVRNSGTANLANMPSNRAGMAVYFIMRRVDGTAVSTSQVQLSTSV